MCFSKTWNEDLFTFFKFQVCLKCIVVWGGVAWWNKYISYLHWARHWTAFNCVWVVLTDSNNFCFYILHTAIKMNNLTPEAKMMREISRQDEDDFLLMSGKHFINMESQLSSMPYCLAIMSQINLLAGAARSKTLPLRVMVGLNIYFTFRQGLFSSRRRRWRQRWLASVLSLPKGTKVF